VSHRQSPAEGDEELSVACVVVVAAVWLCAECACSCYQQAEHASREQAHGLYLMGCAVHVSVPLLQ
jgi:hypothetical protein